MNADLEDSPEWKAVVPETAGARFTLDLLTRTCRTPADPTVTIGEVLDNVAPSG
jgi:hypothetical protein